MVVKYQPGADNPVDYMSRHPTGQGILRSREQHMAEYYVNTAASAAMPIAMTLEEVKRETAKDSTLQAVIKCGPTSGMTLHSTRVLRSTKQLLIQLHQSERHTNNQRECGLHDSCL